MSYRNWNLIICLKVKTILFLVLNQKYIIQRIWYTWDEAFWTWWTGNESCKVRLQLINGARRLEVKVSMQNIISTAFKYKLKDLDIRRQIGKVGMQFHLWILFRVMVSLSDLVFPSVPRWWDEGELFWTSEFWQCKLSCWWGALLW